MMKGVAGSSQRKHYRLLRNNFYFKFLISKPLFVQPQTPPCPYDFPPNTSHKNYFNWNFNIYFLFLHENLNQKIAFIYQPKYDM